MNKKELIKALFKNPTIKALYESGNFNATDINRAILTETEENDYQKTMNAAKKIEDIINDINAGFPAGEYSVTDLDEAQQEILKSYDGKDPIPLLKTLMEDGLASALEGDLGGQIITRVGKDAISELNKTFSKLKNDLKTNPEDSENNTSTTEYSDKEKKEYLNLTKLVLKANALINKTEFVEKQADFLKNLDDKDFLEELVSTYLNVSNQTDQTNRVNNLIDKYAKDESIKPLQQQIAKLKVSLGKIQGKLTTPSEEPSNVSVNQYVDGLANEFDEKATKPALQKLTQWSYETANSDAKNMSILKAFIAYAAQNKKPVNESEQEVQRNVFLDASVKQFVQELESNGVGEDLLTLARSILEKAATNKGFQEIFEDLKDNMNLPASSPEEESIQKKRQQLLQRASSALALLNIENSELLKNDVFMIFMGSVLEKEGVIREAEEQLESYVEKYLPQLENEETRKEFYITQEEVGDLKTFLETNKDNVDKIITAAIKATKDNKDPSMDDESPPELAEFQENWTEVLMTFFGKNPKKSSFMRRLLLSSQAEMLYGVIKVLQDISDPEKMASYTDMNQDDEREKKAEKPETPDSTPAQPANSETAAEENPTNDQTTTDETVREALRDMIPSIRTGTGMNLNNSEPNKPDDTEVEDPQTEPDQPQPEPEAQSDKVELPAKTRRIIKQDLQSMVDLLRQVKKAIGSYSQYSTQKSGDPRFDGSTLKKDMDNLLAQVQDDIYDLWSNLKPVELAPEEDDSSLEEALSGIVLEDADPERQEKIKLVREVYDKAKEEYIYTLMPSMKGNDWGKSQTSAKQILDILKKDEFISLFPTVTKTTGGRVMTLGEAHDSMKQIIQEFIETVRDIVLISKTKYISSTSLTQAKRNLLYISREIAALFRVPSKFSTDEIKQAKEEESTKPENQAITPEPTENLENAPEDNDPGPTSPEDDQPEDPAADEEPTSETSQQKFERFSKENKLIGELAKIISAENWTDDDERLEALMAAQSYMSTYVEEQVIKSSELTDDQKKDIKKYLKDNIIGDTKNEGLIKESEDDKSTRRPDGSDPTEEPHPTDYGLSFLTFLGEKEQKILRSKEGLVKKLAKFIDENFKNLIKDYSNNKYLEKIKKPVETKMQQLDVKYFGGKKQIQDFWTLAAKTLGELFKAKSLNEYGDYSLGGYDYSLPEPKSYGKLDSFGDAAFKSTFRLRNFDRDDRNNLYGRMTELFEYIVKSNAPQKVETYKDGSTKKYAAMNELQERRMEYVSNAWAKALLEKSKDINLRKQFGPFMRFIKKFQKKNKTWYEQNSNGMKQIRDELERIIKEKGLFDYIMKSNHDPHSDDGTFDESLEKALKPIIEAMLKEHYNY